MDGITIPLQIRILIVFFLILSGVLLLGSSISVYFEEMDLELTFLMVALSALYIAEVYLLLKLSKYAYYFGIFLSLVMITGFPIGTLIALVNTGLLLNNRKAFFRKRGNTLLKLDFTGDIDNMTERLQEDA